MAALSVLKTFDPPITSLQGRNVTGADRFGKHLALDCDGLWLIAHLSRGGWLRWIDNPGSAPPKPGKGRWRCACTSSPPTARPRLRPHRGRHQETARGVGGDGPAARPGNRATRAGRARGDPPQFGEILAGTTSRIKTALVDQSLLAESATPTPTKSCTRPGCPRSRRRRSWRPTRWTGCTTRCAPSCPTPSNVRRAGGGPAQGREARRDDGARADRDAVPGVRRHGAGGGVRRAVVPVLPDVPDRWQDPRRPADVTAVEVAGPGGRTPSRAAPRIAALRPLHSPRSRARSTRDRWRREGRSAARPARAS